MMDTKWKQDRYLWNREGPVDLEVARLERTLASLRYRGASKRTSNWRWIVAAAALAAVAALLVWTPFGAGISESPDAAEAGREKPATWELAGLQQTIRNLRPGDVLETSAGESLQLRSSQLGIVTIQPGSRLRLLPQRGNQERLALDFGALRAIIVAPPAEFAVDTPTATAIDLGCVYTLRIGRDGNGAVHVETGWVALQAKGRESFIPSGARSAMRNGEGPGLPIYDDATEQFQRAVELFDSGDPSATVKLLREARSRDALTLWHLLSRAAPSERLQVAARFAELVTLPRNLAIPNLAAGEAAAMDAAWNALSLGDTHWWRTWKRTL
ncbi:MAG: FecR domain-containing protein [Bryobacterales bacterium]|nr:FecR domain-containing protein [Bryobacterales bacterium]